MIKWLSNTVKVPTLRYLYLISLLAVLLTYFILLIGFNMFHEMSTIIAMVATILFSVEMKNYKNNLLLPNQQFASKKERMFNNNITKLQLIKYYISILCVLFVTLSMLFFAENNIRLMNYSYHFHKDSYMFDEGHTNVTLRTCSQNISKEVYCFASTVYMDKKVELFYVKYPKTNEVKIQLSEFSTHKLLLTYFYDGNEYLYEIKNGLVVDRWKK